MLVEFEQNRIVWTIQNFDSAFWQKMVNHFWQSVDAILEDVYHIYVTETITVWCQTINLMAVMFQCSQNYGSPTRVTRLKVAPNMADPSSLNENRLYTYPNTSGLRALAREGRARVCSIHRPYHGMVHIFSKWKSSLVLFLSDIKGVIYIMINKNY